jgi:hypothetical protein
MHDRPRNYREALELLNARRDRLATSRTLSTRQQCPGEGIEIRDQLIAHTDDPLSTYTDTPPPISFRQWSTDIATFYPDGSILVRPWDSVTTRQRMDDMGLPCVRSGTSMGLTRNQTARLWYTGRFAIKGFRYGVPADRSYLVDSDRELCHDEPEPTDTVYVEASEGAHAAYNLGRRRVLRVLREYCTMVDAVAGGSPTATVTASQAMDVMALCLSAPSLKYLRGAWLPELLKNHPLIEVRSLNAVFIGRGRLHDLTNKRELWAQKQVPSRELDQWL